MRCDEFYEKWRRCGNFCEKHPDTAREIDAIINFLDVEPEFSSLSASALRPLIREKDEEVRDRAIEKCGSIITDKERRTGKNSAKVTERDVKQVIEDAKKKVHVLQNSGDNEWYTPKDYISAARQAMGSIDLDPASSDEANTVVGATSYYNEENDGLKQAWIGNIWMNPPYASNLIGEFVTKLCSEVRSGNIPQACVLVNNATETRWFHELLSVASVLMFPKGRVRFWHPRKDTATPLQGQVVLYFGNNINRFCEEFSSFGVLCRVIR